MRVFEKVLDAVALAMRTACEESFALFSPIASAEDGSHFRVAD
ncbi:hypothetical protein RESH_04327 [Rhodopirellula europaea SH398]|uniref:Uncharacterized protein n=1 Tax=Rhodopirellula europaea SH398 TaxID=1263868 RepID=M5SBP3_9BACT|nr:hypothetical protein RESH_04327 [Rhodopirellula europaea SH398]